MIHSSPKPLKVALDLTRKLIRDMGKSLSPEQRRDLQRLERLIDEAERNHLLEITRLHHRSATGEQPPNGSGAQRPAGKWRFWH